jgi:hypothetical protein
MVSAVTPSGPMHTSAGLVPATHAVPFPLAVPFRPEVPAFFRRNLRLRNRVDGRDKPGQGGRLLSHIVAPNRKLS